MAKLGQTEIVSKVVDSFRRSFGTDPDVVSRAPGRLEILGNHTDYNEGTVLSAAVDCAMYIAAAAVGGTQICHVEEDSIMTSSRSFSLKALDEKEEGDWANYIKGVVIEFRKRGFAVPAFNAVLYGTVPLSAGMSSSAALEIAMVEVLKKLCKVDIDWLECAKIGQAAENNYIGAHTGLMDQFSSLKGRKGSLVYSDFRNNRVENVPMPSGSCFVVASSQIKHNLKNEYNDRREACMTAAKTLSQIYPGVKTLRDVTREQLRFARKKLYLVPYRRAMHVVGEIERVFAGCRALQQGDIEYFGRLMADSHLSSRYYFQNSCPELDILVELGQSLPGYYGARLSGGGFGGITVHLVKSELAHDYMERLVSGYEKCTGIKTEAMICQADDGAGFPVWK